jgi:hypothetical protein
MDEIQSTPNDKASGAGTDLDIEALAKELGQPEETLRKRLSGKETKEEALFKFAKSGFESINTTERLKGEKSAIMAERDKFAELAQGSLEEKTPSVSEKVDTGDIFFSSEEERKIVEAAAIVDQTDKLNKELAKAKQELASIKGDIDVTRNMTMQQSAKLREAKIREGRKWLEDTLGEEGANYYLDKYAPEKSPIGKLLNPNWCDNPQDTALANKFGPTLWEFDNPVEAALRQFGRKEDIIKAFSQKAPETEGAGKALSGAEASTKDQVAREFLEEIGIKS